MKKIYRLLVITCFSMSAQSKSISEDLLIPEELGKEEFNVIYSKIPATESGELFLVEYKSTKKKKLEAKVEIATDIITGEKKEVEVRPFNEGIEYGVRFWFTDSKCDESRGYIFIISNSNWMLDDIVIELAGIDCS